MKQKVLVAILALALCVGIFCPVIGVHATGEETDWNTVDWLNYEWPRYEPGEAFDSWENWATKEATLSQLFQMFAGDLTNLYRRDDLYTNTVYNEIWDHLEDDPTQFIRTLALEEEAVYQKIYPMLPYLLISYVHSEQFPDLMNSVELTDADSELAWEIYNSFQADVALLWVTGERPSYIDWDSIDWLNFSWTDMNELFLMDWSNWTYYYSNISQVFQMYAADGCDGYVAEGLIYEINEYFYEDPTLFVRALAQEEAQVQQEVVEGFLMNNMYSSKDAVCDAIASITLTDEDSDAARAILTALLDAVNSNADTGDFVFVPVALMLLSGTGLAWLTRRKKLV